MSSRLQHKCLIIIGGTSGIGKAATLRCLNEGASVVALGLKDEHMDAARSWGNPHAEQLDLFVGDATKPETAVMAVQRAYDRFGAFDGLYHVAGGSGRRFGDGPLHEVSDQGWEKTLHLNLTSVFYSNRAAVQAWLKTGRGGAVLNLTSVLAWAPAPHFFGTQAYATAKAAIVGFTLAAAAQYASANIRFNALAPGLVATPMSARAQQNSQIQDYIRTKQPLDHGRMAEPDDLAGTAAFMLSDDAGFMTGQVIAIDGGWSVAEGQWPGGLVNPGS